jgi:hypothetical protein
VDADTLISRWPFCFHLTAARNLPGIRRSRVLKATDVLLTHAGRLELNGIRRMGDMRLDFGQFDVVLRNQQPLEPTLLELGDGETFADYVRFLNSLVFFWPGDRLRPVREGFEMVEDTVLEDQAILRMPTRSLLAANARVPLWVSPVNAGVGRMLNGRRAQLGRRIYRQLEDADDDMDVVECSYPGEAALPPDSMVSTKLAGPWGFLWGSN